MSLEEIDIRTLLPQQEPFVMVGQLVHYDDQKTTTRTVVRADNIFVDDGVFTASGLIENMAQTCAARIGYINKYIFHQGIQMGFIGAIRNMNLYRCPKVGEVITTDVVLLEEVFGMTLVVATIKIGNELLAEAEMKIALSDQNQQNKS